MVGEEVFQKKAQYLLTNKEYGRWEKILHQRTTGKYIGDAVFGANDGIITTFAIVAGATGASLPNVIIIILGFANILADGISMGASNFLGRKSENDFIKAQEEKEKWEIDNLRELEVEEIRDIYKKKGFKGKDLERAVSIITSNRDVWIDTMMKDELELIIEKDSSPARHGLVTFTAFVFAGLIPLLPFFVPGLINAFLISSILGGALLFTIGALRSLITTVSWLRGGLEMLTTGGAAALAAYTIGLVISRLL